MLLKIFDAEFPYILSYFEPLCLLAKMAAKTVIRPIETISSLNVFDQPIPSTSKTLQEWNLQTLFGELRGPK